MAALHGSTWKKVGIYQSLISSTYDINRNTDLILGLGEKWCPETNTFIFPWGEATITLEDMIAAGYSVLGSPILGPLEREDLKGIEGKLNELRKMFGRSKTKKADHRVWMTYFMENKSEFEHEAFLSLWLSRFVFAGSPFNTISQNVFPIAIHLARGTKLALAHPILASIYRDLSLLKRKLLDLSELDSSNCSDTEPDMLLLTIWSPFHIVQVWAWERFPNLKPLVNVIDYGEPRLARWNSVKSSNLRNVKLPLDGAGSFEWRPCATAKDNLCSKLHVDEEKWISVNDYLDEELESFAQCLRPCKLIGLGCIELYYPHRVAMQFGMDQDIQGYVTRCNETPSIAWERYNKSSKGAKLYIPFRNFKPGVTVRYLEWWKQSMFGGNDTGGSPKSSKVKQMTSKGQDKGQDLSCPPGFSPKSQNSEAGISIEEDNFTLNEQLRYNAKPENFDMFGGKDASANPRGLKILQMSSIGKDKVHQLHDVYGPPGLSLKSQNYKSGLTAEEVNSIVSEALRSTSKDVSVGNGMKAAESPSSSTGKIGAMKAEQKRIQSGPMNGEKGKAMESASESEADRPVHNLDVLKSNERNIGSNFTIETHGVQLEARIRKLQKEADELKAARFGHRMV